MELFYCCPACLAVQSAGIQVHPQSMLPFLDTSVRLRCLDCQQLISVVLREMMFCSRADWIDRGERHANSSANVDVAH
jgi:hypothetical protein